MTDAALYLSAILLAAAAVWVLSPLVEGQRRLPDAASDDVARAAELLAKKAMIYQTIRDAELDRQTGKLSDEDADRMVSELKASAVALLEELDRIDSSGAATSRPRGGRV